MSLSDIEALKTPGQFSLNVVRGDSFRLVVVLTSNGSPISLTGLGGKAQMRKSPDGPITAELTVVVSQDAIGQPDTGKVTVTAPGLTMEPVTDGVWDLEINDGSPTSVFRKTILAGTVTLQLDITKP